MSKKLFDILLLFCFEEPNDCVALWSSTAWFDFTWHHLVTFTCSAGKKISKLELQDGRPPGDASFFYWTDAARQLSKVKQCFTGLQEECLLILGNGCQLTWQAKHLFFSAHKNYFCFLDLMSMGNSLTTLHFATSLMT